MAKLSLHCLCGSSMTGYASPDTAVDGLRALWEQFHKGEGHALVDSRTAQKIRRRQEAAEVSRL